MGGFGWLIGFSALFVLWRFLSIIGSDVGLFTNGGGFGHRRCFCGGHGAWCGGGGWFEPENVLLSVHANEFCVFCFSFESPNMIFSKNQPKQPSIISIFHLTFPTWSNIPIQALRRTPYPCFKTQLLQNHRNTAKLTTTATTAIFKSAPRSATTTSSSSTATASNTQSHHNH